MSHTFLIDECVAFLSKAEYRKAFSKHGWVLVSIGDNGMPNRGPSDAQIYQFMVQSEIRFIITSNHKDFRSLEGRLQSGIVVLGLKNPMTPDVLLNAIDQADKDVPSIEIWRSIFIPLGKYRS